MSTLKKATTKELEEELKRRTQKPKKPNPLPSPDMETIKMIGRMCVDVVRGLDKEGFYDEDLRQYIFEAAMKAFYGANIFDYMRKAMK